MPHKELQEICSQLKTEFPGIVLLAAGGISEENITEFTKIKIDGIVTTSLYHAKPVDIGVKMELPE
jgi:molybdenum transport protein